MKTEKKEFYGLERKSLENLARPVLCLRSLPESCRIDWKVIEGLAGS